ncbi:hypothetical protein [Streptomyces sp. NPDC003635]
MTRWLRTVRTTGLLVVLIGAYGGGTACGVDATPSASASPSVSRAGSLAGEGRDRPGRPDVTVPDEEPVAEPSPAAPSEAAASPAPAEVVGVRAEPVLEVLPLGSGLMLIGLGLGLAFVGLRLRRTD